MCAFMYTEDNNEDCFKMAAKLSLDVKALQDHYMNMNWSDMKYENEETNMTDDIDHLETLKQYIKEQLAIQSNIRQKHMFEADAATAAICALHNVLDEIDIMRRKAENKE